MGFLANLKARRDFQARKSAREFVTNVKLSDEEFLEIEHEHIWWQAVLAVERFGQEPPALHLHDFPSATQYRVVFSSVTGDQLVEPGAWTCSNEGYAAVKGKAMKTVLLRSALNQTGGGPGYVWLADANNEWISWVFCVGLGTSGMHISEHSRDVGQIDTDMANELGGLFFTARSVPTLARRYGFH